MCRILNHLKKELPYIMSNKNEIFISWVRCAIWPLPTARQVFWSLKTNRFYFWMNLQSVAVCLLGIIFSSMHFFLSTRHILFCTIKGCRSSLKSPHYIFNMQSCILLHQVTARNFWIFLPKFRIYFSLFILKSIQITTIIYRFSWAGFRTKFHSEFWRKNSTLFWKISKHQTNMKYRLFDVFELFKSEFFRWEWNSSSSFCLSEFLTGQITYRKSSQNLTLQWII